MDAISGSRGRDVEAVGDLRRMVEMAVQGVDVFEDAATPTDDEVVDGDDMLGVFWKRDSADMLGSARSQ